MARKKRNDLTDEQKRRIVERFQAGEAASAIAEGLGRYTSVVYRVLHAAGVNVSSKHPRPKGGLNGAAKKPAMARAGRPPKTDNRWITKLGALIARIRRLDPGVTLVEFDVETGRYTYKRNTVERGEIS